MADQSPPHNYIPAGPLDAVPSGGFRDHHWRLKALEAVLEGVLKPGNEQTRHVLVATRLPSRLPDRYPYNLKPPEERKWLKGLFWVPEGGDSGSGFTFGPGFNAHATDFPEGTRLVVTAQILPPEEDEPEPVDGDCPESKLPTGAHDSDWYGGGRCSWCGDLGPLEEFNA